MSLVIVSVPSTASSPSHEEAVRLQGDAGRLDVNCQNNDDLVTPAQKYEKAPKAFETPGNMGRVVMCFNRLGIIYKTSG